VLPATVQHRALAHRAVGEAVYQPFPLVPALVFEPMAMIDTVLTKSPTQSWAVPGSVIGPWLCAMSEGAPKASSVGS
jgi:hypothetical protein